jgi:hypothetical protein
VLCCAVLCCAGAGAGAVLVLCCAVLYGVLVLALLLVLW